MQNNTLQFKGWWFVLRWNRKKENTSSLYRVHGIKPTFLCWTAQGHGAKGDHDYEFSLDFLEPVKPEVFYYFLFQKCSFFFISDKYLTLFSVSKTNILFWY